MPDLSCNQLKLAPLQRNKCYLVAVYLQFSNGCGATFIIMASKLLLHCIIFVIGGPLFVEGSQLKSDTKDRFAL